MWVCACTAHTHIYIHLCDVCVHTYTHTHTKRIKLDLAFSAKREAEGDHVTWSSFSQRGNEPGWHCIMLGVFLWPVSRVRVPLQSRSAPGATAGGRPRVSAHKRCPHSAASSHTTHTGFTQRRDQTTRQGAREWKDGRPSASSAQAVPSHGLTAPQNKKRRTRASLKVEMVQVFFFLHSPFV